MKRVSLLICFSCLLLFGCTSKDQVVRSQTSEPNAQLTETNKKLEQKISSLESNIADLEKQVNHYENREKELQDDIRSTFNYTIMILQAMRAKDYAYLEAVSTPRLTVNKDKDTFTFTDESGKASEIKFLDESIDDLEYRFYHYPDTNTMELGFANIQNEMQIEIYFEFVRENNGKWLFNRYITN